MVASEYVFPGLILLGGSFFFLEMGMNMKPIKELTNPYSIISFIDVAKFFFYGLALFFLFMAVLFGKAVVDDSVTNMSSVFDNVQTTFVMSILVMFIGLLGYVFFILPWILKKQFDRAKEINKQEEEAQ